MRDLQPTGSRKALPTKPGWGAEEARRGCLVSGNDFIQSPIVAWKQFPFTNRPAIVLLVPRDICGWAGLHNCQRGPCQSPWLRGAGTAGRAQRGVWVPWVPWWGSLNLATQPQAGRIVLWEPEDTDAPPPDCFPALLHWFGSPRDNQMCDQTSGAVATVWGPSKGRVSQVIQSFYYF